MKVVILLALVAVCTAADEPRKCYICSDIVTVMNNCTELEESLIETCGEGVPAYDKCFQTGASEKREHGCTNDDEDTFCKSKTDCSVCAEDGCNSSSSSSVLASAVLVTVSAILLKMYN